MNQARVPFIIRLRARGQSTRNGIAPAVLAAAFAALALAPAAVAQDALRASPPAGLAAAGDLDEDGDLDLVTSVASDGPRCGLAVALDRGAGPQEVARLPLPQLCDGLALGDVDGDGDLDIVASQGGPFGQGSAIALLLNHGDATFASPRALPAGGAGPAGLLAADLDGDGWPDLAVALHGVLGGGRQVAVLRNDGAGALRPAQTTTLPLAGAAAPRRLAAGDMDGDGTTDLVAACDGSRLVVLFQRGGAFVAGPAIDARRAASRGAALPADVALADADGDGDLDALYGGAVLLLNDGAGALAARTLEPVLALPPAADAHPDRLAPPLSDLRFLGP